MVKGVAELVQNYAVDGIHFDDYFTPRQTPHWTRPSSPPAARGSGRMAAAERHRAGESGPRRRQSRRRYPPLWRQPAGQPDNDLGQQYSDVKAWLAAEGENAVVDYLCPQIYWGCGYTLQSGSTRFAFENIVPEWLAMPRAASTALYFGLGPIASARATAVPTRTAGASGVRAALLPGRWNVCTASVQADGRSTGTIRCSGRLSRSLPTPNVRRWPL